jgi:hypothetical protein
LAALFSSPRTTKNQVAKTDATVQDSRPIDVA